MVDKQQLAAMGEHMRETEECNQQKHSATQVMAWAGDYEKEGGHGLIVEMLKSYAELLTKHPCKPEFKVPDGWRLVPVEPEFAMLAADGCKEHHDGQECNFHKNRRRIWSAMLATAPEYKP